MLRTEENGLPTLCRVLSMFHSSSSWQHQHRGDYRSHILGSKKASSSKIAARRKNVPIRLFITPTSIYLPTLLGVNSLWSGLCSELSPLLKLSRAIGICWRVLWSSAAGYQRARAIFRTSVPPLCVTTWRHTTPSKVSSGKAFLKENH